MKPAWGYLVSNLVYLCTPNILFVISASQAWTFATILPLLIGHKIPEDDLNWECYLLLVQILQISTAKVSSEPSSLYLAALINQHHQLFIRCYPGVKLIPKAHYLIHFPKQICRLVTFMLMYLYLMCYICNLQIGASCNFLVYADGGQKFIFQENRKDFKF